jgi:hypothetical protein
MNKKRLPRTIVLTTLSLLELALPMKSVTLSRGFTARSSLKIKQVMDKLTTMPSGVNF